MTSMRIVLPALAALAMFIPSAGHADPYKWCAQYEPDGGRNCGFTTYQQCMLTVSGVGGFCERNSFYTGPERSTRQTRKPDRS
jgi:hypothetical protein